MKLEPKKFSGWVPAAAYILLLICVAGAFYQNHLNDQHQQKRLCQLNTTLRAPLTNYIQSQVKLTTKAIALHVPLYSTNDDLAKLQRQSTANLFKLNKAYQNTPPANCVILGQKKTKAGSNG